MKISLWSGPRNCSTALMYSFGARSDMQILDEPLFAHFLLESGAPRPSRQEVLETMTADAWELLRQIQSPHTSEAERPHLFMKHMACHLRGFALDAFSDHHHVLLVRHPEKVLRSYSAYISEPTMEDLGYAWQAQLLNHCRIEGWPVTVLDADQLVHRPSEMLQALCHRLKLPWQSAMMHWPSGGRAEDGPWAKSWYQAVHASTGWRPPAGPSVAEQRGTNERVAERLQPLLQQCLLIHAQLVESALT